MGLLRTAWTCRNSLILFLTPFLLLPLPLLYTNKAGRCAYAILIMAVYWVTEVLPMAATALLPVVLMPGLGIVGANQICVNYFKETNMLLFGGLVLANAIQRWNLHKRIALRVLLSVGSKPSWLMFGFMSTTAFLSMWISNTATTAMMVPIVHAVLTQLRQHRCLQEGTDVEEQAALVPIVSEEATRSQMVLRVITNEPANGTPSAVQHLPRAEPQSPESITQQTETRKFDSILKGMTLCVAYAANIGGTATLMGTGANLVFKGQVDTLFGTGTGLNFSTWFIFSLPNMVISLLVAWVWLQLVFLGPRAMIDCFRRGEREGEHASNAVIRAEYDKLGEMSFAEIAVLGHFITLALLWITRNPEFMPGWSSIPIFEPGFVTDAVVAIAIALSLFMFPSRRPNYFCFRQKGDMSEPAPAPGLLDWQTVHKDMSWGLVIMVGGSFALANACKESGLSSAIGEAFLGFHGFPTWGLVFMLCTLTAVFTEITSNVATATIFLPILAELAIAIDTNPLYLMIPVTISTSFAFMLPVATPPNAIAFAFGNLKIFDMVRVGVVMNVICLAVLQVAINTWGVAYFHLDTLPSWIPSAAAEASNVTSRPVINSTLV